MKRFQFGKSYGAADGVFDPIKVIDRTTATIKVKNSCGNVWRMKIRTDEHGEYVVDSSVPANWRQAATYRAIWEEQEEA